MLVPIILHLNLLLQSINQPEKNINSSPSKKTQKHVNVAKGTVVCRLYYIEFLVETYSAVSTENILRSGWVTDIRDPAILQQILEWIGHDGLPAKFENRDVRLCVQVQKPKRTIFVDQDGAVRLGKKEFLIPPSDFLRLNRLLNRIALPQYDKNR